MKHVSILANNRDEFLARETRHAAVHHFGTEENSDADVVSGLDAQGGGTWLGINRHGRIAMM